MRNMKDVGPRKSVLRNLVLIGTGIILGPAVFSLMHGPDKLFAPDFGSNNLDNCVYKTAVKGEAFSVRMHENKLFDCMRASKDEIVQVTIVPLPGDRQRIIAVRKNGRTIESEGSIFPK